MNSTQELSRRTLTPADLEQELTSLPMWSVADGKLHREYRFRNFTYAFGFMAAAATVIEKLDHHPEWSNVYGKVTVDLWTHSAGGITQFDLTLAGALEEIAARLA